MRRNILSMVNENSKAGLQANIFQQSDDKFVSEAVLLIEDIRKVVTENKLIKDSEQLMIESPVGSLSISNLEKLFSDRFLKKTKANFKILADVAKNAFAFPMLPNTSKSILTGNTISVEKQIGEALNELELYANSGEAKKETMDISTINGVKNLYNKILENSKSIEEMLKIGSVEFDLKEATINGLPDDFCFIIGIDLYHFIAKTNLTNAEILSILIHETGHCYTFLLDLYRKADTNVVLTDIMTSIGNSTPEKIIITLSKEFNLPMPKTNDKNTGKELLSTIMTVFEEVIKDKNKNIKNSAAAERLADQFPVRFGLGKEFFNAITYFNSSTINKIYSEVDMQLGVPIADAAIILSIIGVLLVFVTGGFVMGILPLVGITVAFRGVLLFVRFFVGTDDANATIYDDGKRRLESIRNEAVRRLNGMVPKDATERSLLKLKFMEIDDMDKAISKMRKSRSSLGMMGEMLIPGLRKKSRETFINELLENMEANKLKVLSEKIKLSGGL